MDVEIEVPVSLELQYKRNIRYGKLGKQFTKKVKVIIDMPDEMMRYKESLKKDMGMNTRIKLETKPSKKYF